MEIDGFIADLRRRNYSPHTLRAYQSILESVANFVKPIEIANVAPEQLRAYLGTKTGRVIKQQSLSALRSFAAFVYKNSGIKPKLHVAAKAVQAPRHIRPLPKALSVSDARRVVEDAGLLRNTQSAWETYRDAALCLLLYGAGLRTSEALSLPYNRPLGDDGKTVRVVGKGQKERLVPLLPIVRASISLYQLGRHTAGLSPLRTLFEGMSDRDARRLMQRIRGRLGLPAHATPHALRHSFATHLYNEGADFVVLANLLGHTSVSTTAIYAQVGTEKLKSELEKCFPERY